jgi:hypothetical protein
VAFPTSVDSFSTKVDNVSTVFAADVNTLQTAVVAIENFILGGFAGTTAIDLAVRSVTAVATGSYVATAANGGADYGAAVRFGGGPEKDITHPTFGGGTGATAAQNSAAIIAAAAGGGRVYIPAGHFTCNPLVLSAITGLEIRGAGRNTFLDITGTATEGIRIVNCPQFVMGDLTVRTTSGTLTYIVHYTATTSAEEASFERMLIGAGGGAYANGMAVGADTSVDVAEITLFHVRVENGATNAGFIAGNGTAANVLNCRAIDCTSIGHAIGVFMNACAIGWTGGTVEHNTVTDFKILNSSSAPVIISGTRGADGASKRFLDVAGGNTNPAAVTLLDCTGSGFTDAGGVVISYVGSGSLTLIGTSFWSTPFGTRPSILNASAAGGNPLSVVCINTAWDNDNPFSGVQNTAILSAIGTRKIDNTGALVLPTDGGTFNIAKLRVGGVGGVAGGGNPGSVGDIVARRTATTAAYYFGDSSTAYLYFDGTNLSVGAGLGGLLLPAGGAFWGHAAVGAQPAAPVTLADVIAIIRGCGLSA